MRRISGKECHGLSELNGPLLVINGIAGVGYGEMVRVEDGDGKSRYGRVLEVHPESAVIEVFEGTSGLGLPNTSVHFPGRPF